MKPYGRHGKVEIASCGCCAAHDGEEDYYKWRTDHRKRFLRRDKKRARQESRKNIAKDFRESVLSRRDTNEELKLYGVLIG
ncbi:hypothetical protein Silverhawkium_gp86 [Shigella phage Silverhawkium]|uniref:Uncharacterized protein n=1 Tax=Shigella phage Silverhawkium TaxID=2530185 RepID=A0A482JKA6_9CAUD|nr:hypothetical protein Silverhawkium_gp86 [Shigella phage Silverhawkium]